MSCSQGQRVNDGRYGLNQECLWAGRDSEVPTSKSRKGLISECLLLGPIWVRYAGAKSFLEHQERAVGTVEIQ